MFVKKCLHNISVTSRYLKLSFSTIWLHLFNNPAKWCRQWSWFTSIVNMSNYNIKWVVNNILCSLPIIRDTEMTVSGWFVSKNLNFTSIFLYVYCTCSTNQFAFNKTYTDAKYIHKWEIGLLERRERNIMSNPPHIPVLNLLICETQHSREEIHRIL